MSGKQRRFTIPNIIRFHLLSAVDDFDTGDRTPEKVRRRVKLCEVMASGWDWEFVRSHGITIDESKATTDIVLNEDDAETWLNLLREMIKRGGLKFGRLRNLSCMEEVLAEFIDGKPPRSVGNWTIKTSEVMASGGSRMEG